MIFISALPEDTPGLGKCSLYPQTDSSALLNILETLFASPEGNYDHTSPPDTSVLAEMFTLVIVNSAHLKLFLYFLDKVSYVQELE